MAEFTQTMSGDSRYSIKLTVTEVIPSDYVSTNKTNVNYTLTATKSGGSGYWYNSATNPVKVTINGTEVVNTSVAYDFRNSTPKTITLASGTVTGIEHNADGSKTIAVSGYFKDNGNSLGQATASGNLTLTTIPRASVPTVDEAPWDYLGNTLTIRTNRASNSFTHTLKFKVGSTQIGSAVTGVGATYSWTPAIATYAPYTTNGLYAYVTIECTTYNGGTQIGTTQTTSMLMYVPANSTTAPTCSISIQEDNATMKTLNWGVYVKGKSQLKVTLTGTPKYNAYITDYSITANGNTKSGSNSSTGTFTTTYTTPNVLTGNGSVTASVKDNRGSTTNATAQSYTVQDYSNPQITTAQVYRCDSSGNQDDSGTYIKYVFAGSISSVSNKNSKTFTLKWKPKNGSDTTVGTWTSSYTCNQTAILSGFSTSTEYIFTFSATDSFTTTALTKEIGTEPDLMNFNASGKSMAIGGVSQRTSSEKVLDIYTNTEFKAPVIGEVVVGGIKSNNIIDMYVAGGRAYNTTIVRYKDGKFSIQTTPTQTVYNRITKDFTLQAGKTYTLSVNENLPTGVTLYPNNVTNIGLVYNDVAIYPGGSSKTFTPTQTGTINIAIMITTSFNGTYKILSLQLEENDHPTPYYPHIDYNNEDCIYNRLSNSYMLFKNTGTNNSITVNLLNTNDRQALFLFGVTNGMGSVCSIIITSSSSTVIKNLGTVNAAASRSGDVITIGGLTNYAYITIVSQANIS